MEENKKSGGGDVRAFALSWDGEWDKARKLVFSFISTLAHGGALRSPLTSLAARKKSRFAEKKSASPKKNRLWGVRRVVAWGRWVAWLMLEWERWRDGGMALERADGIVGFVVIKFLNIDLRITVEIHKYADRKLCAK